MTGPTGKEQLSRFRRAIHSLVSGATLGALVSLAGVSPSSADDFGEGELTVAGSMALDLRYFPRSSLYTETENQHLNGSLVFEPEFNYSWLDGANRLTFVPFARLDDHDSDRSHVDIREAKFLHQDDGWDMVIGVDKVFWGVTESRHLVDIINQTDAVEDVDGEDKLGQPMVSYTRFIGDSAFTFYALPYFRERTYPGREGRLRGGTRVDNDQATYDRGDGEWTPDFALRYTTVIDDLDLGLSYFNGISREATFSLGTSDDGDSVLVPHYDQISQAGIDAQYTMDAWLLKLEAIGRSGQGKTFGAISTGFEYTFYGVVGEAGDLGVLVEYHYDGRDDTAPGTLYDNDLFFGTRITLNDVDDTDFLAGVIVDRITQSASYSVEADTRLNEHVTVEVEARYSDNTATRDINYGARDDDHIQMRLAYHF